MSTLLFCLVMFFIVVCSSMAGAFFFLLKSVRDAEVGCWNSKRDFEQKIKEFNDVTEKASKANNSLGEMLSDIQMKVTSFEDRINMIQSHRMPGGKSVR